MNQSYLVAFWSPFPIPDYRPCLLYFSSLFQDFGDIQCFDCKDGRDRRNQKLMHQADLVVILLPQQRQAIFQALCRHQLRFANSVYLIADYIPVPDFDLRRIAFEFRLPLSRLGCIPYHPRSIKSIRQKDLASSCSNYVSYSDFCGELYRSGRRILQALGF